MLQRKAKRKGGLEFPAERTSSKLKSFRHGPRRGLLETIIVRLSKPFVYRIRSVFESARVSNSCVFRMHSSFERMESRKGSGSDASQSALSRHIFCTLYPQAKFECAILAQFV